MAQQLTQMPTMGTQPAPPVTRMVQVKTIATNNKWKIIGVLFVIGVICCLIFIPGAPIYNAIWGSDKLKTVVPPNNSNLPPVPTQTPSMRQDGNYNSIVNGYKLDTGFRGDRNTAIVIVGNFMAEQKVGGGVSPQAFDDAKLYRILTAATVDAAKQAVVS